MKAIRIVSALVGAVVGIVSALGLAYLIGWGWGPLYANDEDMSRNVKVVLAAIAAAAVLGAAAGWRLAQRREERR